MEIKKEELRNGFDNKGVIEDVKFIINSIYEVTNKAFKQKYDKFSVEPLDDDLVMRIRPFSSGFFRLGVEDYTLDEGGISFKKVRDYFFSVTGIYPDLFIVEDNYFTICGRNNEDKLTVSIKIAPDFDRITMKMEVNA